MKTKETVKPESFCTRFDEECKVVENHNREQKGYELRVVNRANLARPMHLDSSWPSIHLQR